MFSVTFFRQLRAGCYWRLYVNATARSDQKPVRSGQYLSYYAIRFLLELNQTQTKVVLSLYFELSQQLIQLQWEIQQQKAVEMHNCNTAERGREAPITTRMKCSNFKYGYSRNRQFGSRTSKKN